MDDRQEQPPVEQHLLNYVRALKKPLIFVARNEFANLSTVRDLDKTLLAVIDRALEMSFGPAQKELLRDVKSNFLDFQNLQLEAKRDAITRALGKLRTLDRQLGGEGPPAEPASRAVNTQPVVEARPAEIVAATSVPDITSEGQRPRGRGPRAESGDASGLGRTSQEVGSSPTDPARKESRRDAERKSAKRAPHQKESGRPALPPKEASTRPEVREPRAVVPPKEEADRPQPKSATVRDLGREEPKGDKAAGRDPRVARSSRDPNRPRERGRAPGQGTRPGGSSHGQGGASGAEPVRVPRARIQAPYQERSDQDLNWGRPRRLPARQLSVIPLMYLPSDLEPSEGESDQPSAPSSGKGERPERQDRRDRPERRDRGEKQRPEKPGQGGRPERSVGQEQAERPERTENAERPERAERPQRPERPDRRERGDRAREPQPARAENSRDARPERGRGERTESKDNRSRGRGPQERGTRSPVRPSVEQSAARASIPTPAMRILQDLDEDIAAYVEHVEFPSQIEARGHDVVPTESATSRAETDTAGPANDNDRIDDQSAPSAMLRAAEEARGNRVEDAPTDRDVPGDDELEETTASGWENDPDRDDLGETWQDEDELEPEDLGAGDSDRGEETSPETSEWDDEEEDEEELTGEESAEGSTEDEDDSDEDEDFDVSISSRYDEEEEDELADSEDVRLEGEVDDFEEEGLEPSGSDRYSEAYEEEGEVSQENEEDDLSDDSNDEDNQHTSYEDDEPTEEHDLMGASKALHGEHQGDEVEGDSGSSYRPHHESVGVEAEDLMKQGSSLSHLEEDAEPAGREEDSLATGHGWGAIHTATDRFGEPRRKRREEEQLESSESRLPDPDLAETLEIQLRSDPLEAALISITDAMEMPSRTGRFESDESKHHRGPDRSAWSRKVGPESPAEPDAVSDFVRSTLLEGGDDLTIHEFMGELIEPEEGLDVEALAAVEAELRLGEDDEDDGVEEGEEDESVSGIASDDERRRGRRRRRRRRGGPREAASDQTSSRPEGAGQTDPTVVAAQLARLSMPMAELKGVGPKLGAILEQQGIRTLQDILYYLPLQYQDRRSIMPIQALTLGEPGMFIGTVEASDIVQQDHQRNLVLRFTDASGTIDAVWINVRSNYLKNRFRLGGAVLVWGMIEEHEGQRVCMSPETELMGGQDDEGSLHVERIVPIYPSIEGIGQKTLRRIIQQALTLVKGQLVDPMPTAIRSRQHLMELERALWEVHYPSNEASFDQLAAWGSPAHRTLMFHTFFLLELALAFRRRALANESGTALRVSHKRMAQLLRSMSPLTDDQCVAMEEIKRDISAPHPMIRILQADVNTGAMQVASLAIAMALDSDAQVAVIAPTESLVEQHAATLRQLLKPLNVEVEVVTAAVRGRVREKLLHRLRKGEVQLVVGTHALFHETVGFKRLGLAILDEQYRVGLIQPQNLLRRGVNPDTLVLVSSPVPKSLLMTLYGDITWSTLKTPTPDRRPIETHIVVAENREELEQRVRCELTRGQQLYYISPSAHESDRGSVQRVVDIATRLREEVFPGISVGHLHSRMSPEEQEEVLGKFKSRVLQVLVTNGDLDGRLKSPRANLMIIERVETLTLVPIHTMRSLLGESYHPPLCLLVPSPQATHEELERLQMLEQTEDGFALADQDLRFRMPQDYLGVRQAGLAGLWPVDPLLHQNELEGARREAFRWLDDSPEASDEQQRKHLANLVRQRWQGLVEHLPQP